MVKTKQHVSKSQKISSLSRKKELITSDMIWTLIITI